MENRLMVRAFFKPLKITKAFRIFRDFWRIVFIKNAGAYITDFTAA